ncbi:phosphate acyltransferase PlsX [bacterium]|nr:MAG: phosphate acyltransferase PlsX [bacterium]
MSIALDAMGGDNAPGEIVKGALEALPDLRMPLILVGHQDKLKPFLPAQLPANLSILHAPTEVGMDEKPTEAYRKKKDSSLMMATQLVKDGQADAMVSAGNTGAAVTFSLLVWRPIEGIHRPAIAAFMPNYHKGFLLMDAGASPDADPEYLLEYAIMARTYARVSYGKPNARVHLLNIGEEDGKGNAFTKAAFTLLAREPWFAGNIEGKDMYANADVDIVLCDGFVGNVVLKTAEGVAETMVRLVRDAVPKNPAVKWAYTPVRWAFGPLRKRVDYAEYGGSPLLGLNGLCTICHGRSNAYAIKNALLKTQTMIEGRLVESIREAMQ